MARILMYDSARIQEGDAHFLNKRLAKQKKPLIKPLYTEADVDKTLPHFVAVPYGEPYRIDVVISNCYTQMRAIS
jgi:metallo-beta-lactamase family protein